MNAFPIAQWGADVAAMFTFQNNATLVWVFFLGYLIVSVWYHIWVIRVEDKDYNAIADRVRKGGH